MTYEQALALAGHLPSWELRAVVHDAHDPPRRDYKIAYAKAAEVVLSYRDRGAQRSLTGKLKS